MSALDSVYRFLLRFRYPVSLPENVADALGIPVSNFLTFDEFVKHLSSPNCVPTNLKKYMPREDAEKAFKGALRQERFKQTTLCSYYFNEGWMEFMLSFDEKSRLRRLYLQHKQIPSPKGIEITLSK